MLTSPAQSIHQSHHYIGCTYRSFPYASGQFYYDANFTLYNVTATALVRVLRLFGDSRAPLHDPSAHRISLSRYPML
jgi:hypothetical protein